MFDSNDEFDPMILLQIREQLPPPPPPEGGFFILQSGKGFELENGYLMRLAGK